MGSSYEMLQKFRIVEGAVISILFLCFRLQLQTNRTTFLGSFGPIGRHVINAGYARHRPFQHPMVIFNIFSIDLINYRCFVY